MKQDHLALVAGGAGGIFTSVYDKAWWLIEGDAPIWSLGQALGLLVFFVLGGAWRGSSRKTTAGRPSSWAWDSRHS